MAERETEARFHTAGKAESRGGGGGSGNATACHMTYMLPSLFLVVVLWTSRLLMGGPSFQLHMRLIKLRKHEQTCRCSH